MKYVSLIVAIADNGVIGRRGTKLPWHQAADIKRFRTITLDHTVIMGRKTYESTGALPRRRNVIISRKPDFKADGCEVFTSLHVAVQATGESEEVFVIGGAELLEMALPVAQTLYLTLVHGDPRGDVHFDYQPQLWTEISSADYTADTDNDFDYSFKVLEK
jgi:dihydrofolate reductase